MSFVGRIGHFMQGSGLREASGTVYGENTVNKCFQENQLLGFYLAYF